MAIAAPILPPALESLALPEDVRNELVAAWQGWWEPFRATLRAAPPEPDTPAERVALARFGMGMVVINDRFGVALQPLLRAGFARVFEDLLAQEDADAPTMRRLGIKLLGRAVEVLGEVFEVAAIFMPLSLSLRRVVPEDENEFVRRLDPPSVALLRLQLAVFMAFDLVQDPSLNEFTDWARRAHLAAQRAAPFVAIVSSFRAGGGDGLAYRLMPPNPDEFSSDEEALAWEGEGWEEFGAQG